MISGQRLIQSVKLRNIYMNFKRHIMLKQKLLQQVARKCDEMKIVSLQSVELVDDIGNDIHAFLHGGDK